MVPIENNFPPRGPKIVLGRRLLAEFGSILPHVLRDPVASTAFALGCAAAGAAVGTAGLVRLSGWRRSLCAAMLGVGGLMASWFVWTLL